MKIKFVAISVLFILVASMVASTAIALPTKDAKTKVAVASWATDTPVAGGWVFAAVTQSQDPTIGNKIYEWISPSWSSRSS